MILEVQIQNFSASQNFHFQQIPGGLNIDIFGENWHEALQTIDAQMFFWSVFLKTHIKKVFTVKNAILAVFGN